MVASEVTIEVVARGIHRWAIGPVGVLAVAAGWVIGETAVAPSVIAQVALPGTGQEERTALAAGIYLGAAAAAAIKALLVEAVVPADLTEPAQGRTAAVDRRAWGRAAGAVAAVVVGGAAAVVDGAAAEAGGAGKVVAFVNRGSELRDDIHVEKF